MNHLTGIGGQQSAGATETAGAASTSRTAKSATAAMTNGRGGGASPVRVDEARLSTAARVMTMALLGSDVRTDKVTALQQSIVGATYDVPATAVADKVMRALLE